MMQDENGKKYVSNLINYELNMDNIMKFWYSKDEKKIKEYKYLIMLDLELEELKYLAKDRLVGKFMEDLETLNKDPKFREYMSIEEDQKKCHNTELSLAREEGIEKGKEEGSKEKAIETTKNFLIKGFKENDIAECTGLSLDEVKKIKKELNK